VGGRRTGFLRLERMIACYTAQDQQTMEHHMTPSQSSPAGHGLDPAAGNVTTAYLLLRLTLGGVFLFYGIGKLRMGLGAFNLRLVDRFEASLLPAWSVSAFAWVLPFVEVAVGGLLILGLFTRWALLAAGVLMAALAMGAVVEPNPPTVAYNLIYATIIFLLLIFAPANRWSLDTLLRSGSSRTGMR
jgi:thiosulfate dehydrogenase (quinone) large subunit